MKSKNFVFVGQSLDGYIAGKNGELDWLESIPNPEKSDMGYLSFMNKIDALVMGRKTFDTVCQFDGAWPYDKPVYVLSNNMSQIPSLYKSKAFLIKGSLTEVLDQIHNNGHFNLYINGGNTIQNFLKEDLIDEITVSTLPILLGGGIPLFGHLTDSLRFDLHSSTIYLDQIVQSTYKRANSNDSNG